MGTHCELTLYGLLEILLRNLFSVCSTTLEFAHQAGVLYSRYLNKKWWVVPTGGRIKKCSTYIILCSLLPLHIKLFLFLIDLHAYLQLDHTLLTIHRTLILLFLIPEIEPHARHAYISYFLAPIQVLGTI